MRYFEGSNLTVTTDSDQLAREKAVSKLTQEFIDRGVSRFTARAWAEAETGAIVEQWAYTS